MYGEDADDVDRIPELERKMRNLHARFTTISSGDANSVVRNSGDSQGLDAWRRRHNECNPISSMTRVTIFGNGQTPTNCYRMEALGFALEDWLAKKRRDEEFSNRDGSLGRVQDDSLMAAVYNVSRGKSDVQG